MGSVALRQLSAYVMSQASSTREGLLAIKCCSMTLVF
jgi:hypothetical protein